MQTQHVTVLAEKANSAFSAGVGKSPVDKKRCGDNMFEKTKRAPRSDHCTHAISQRRLDEIEASFDNEGPIIDDE